MGAVGKIMLTTLVIGLFMVGCQENSSLVGDDTFQRAAVVQNSAIGDYVWVDTNMDGIQDEEEMGMEGVTVNLYDCDENLLATTTTDADGNYAFDGLDAGDYMIGFVLPEDYVFTMMNQGENDSVDSDVDTETGMTECITVGEDIVDNTIDAGIYMMEMPGGVIGDYVWVDANMNGIQDEDEMGMEGIEVTLYDCEDNMLASTTTDADGMYWFTELEAGDYMLGFGIPEDYMFTMMNQGDDDAVDSDVYSETGMTECITLEMDEMNGTVDAGIYMMEDDGCTYGKGFWKNHSGFGPQDDLVTDLLPIWLGNSDGESSIAVETAQIAYDILRQHEYGHPSNGITRLYAHFLTAKLNVANGASDEDIADYIVEADNFLADNDWEDWNELDHDTRMMINDWKDMFEDYNEGDIGPGNCDDDNGDEVTVISSGNNRY